MNCRMRYERDEYDGFATPYLRRDRSLASMGIEADS